MKTVDKRKLKEKEYLFSYELTALSGVRSSTIKYYGDEELLPYCQEAEGLRRRFPTQPTLERLAEINQLKKENKTIEEIKKILCQKKPKK